MRFAFDPVVLLLIALACWLYVRALGIVRRRGLRVGRGQQACWWIGIAFVTVALNGPLDAYDGELMSAHMAQHLLLGDIAAPFLLAGMRAPMLLFFLPRPALVLLARRRWLRTIFRTLRQPLVALPVYVLTIYAWHASVLFEGALAHPLLHALQHEFFLAANLLLWWPVLEPQRRRMPGHLWKIGYIFAARMSTMFLGMIFVFTRGVLYEGAYGDGPRPLGFSPRSDQGTAGGLMMTLDIIVIVTSLAWFFYHASQQEDRDQAAAARAASPAGPI
ncbi:cytochrome c oxidase assembly protein [Conexibacter sp. CPCC 206217]|uniref:cytochrome c oxidase assembly protein n=1 Tax=Conexibacter sp. CPCC 206217 TaxID=3064574 RepID=UPI00272072EF|nr:cytochrome c oxidase assembly protein [Conexibacter sp. CPCC 206217]MDO8209141.1 cytochrome c oxidase assembly protein [Conexibacter sp. CPCC 206217]